MIVALVTALASRINSDRCHVQIQLSISCPPDSEPEPDAAIIRGVPREYKTRLPGPADVSCVIEAAHSSLDRDREDKLPIYARAGIPQYVIINLQNNTIEVHSDPDPAAEQYRTKATIEVDQTLEFILPEGRISVQASDLLP